MSLNKLQQEFNECQALLVSFAIIKGYGLTRGDGYRDPRVHGEFGEKLGYGARWSCHKVRLAQDHNLFLDVDGDGKPDYITDGEHQAWKDLGKFWESLHPLARWGGRFGDANHFSFEYQGYK